ncbi:MAG: hypothetical protein GVY18_09035 [Bacteroidetes bacterium]|jgi:hypothetical protein|nr:hypothetical protein [Bacteroidota bacterium]
MPVPGFDGEFAYQWDDLWLGGTKMPGIAQLGGDGIKRKLDVKRQKGKAGARIRDEGDEPAKFHASLFFWNASLFTEFESLKEDINPRKRGGEKYVLDLYHPAAAFLGIDRVYVVQIGMPEHDKRQATVRIQIDFLEWFPDPPPQKNLGKGKGGPGCAHGDANKLAEEAGVSCEEAETYLADSMGDEENLKAGFGGFGQSGGNAAGSTNTNSIF